MHTIPGHCSGAQNRRLVVVELGPGTGAFTKAIQRRLAGRGHHLAIEIDPRFARRPAAPQIDVTTSDARCLREILTERGHHHADVIVSGLPWAAGAPNRQDDLPGAIGIAGATAATHCRYGSPVAWPLVRHVASSSAAGRSQGYRP